MNVNEHLRIIAQQLVHELEPILSVKEVTDNSDLLGDYAEAAIRKLIQRVVAPMRVSQGAVIDHPMPEKLKQVDVIIWAPFPVPGLFEVGDFALVPRSSAFGLLEIKRSNYSGADERLETFSQEGASLAAERLQSFKDEGNPAMGLVCVLERPASRGLRQLLDKGKAVAIFEKKESNTAKVTVRSSDVLRLINFLHYVTWRYRMQSGQSEYPQLVIPKNDGN